MTTKFQYQKVMAMLPPHLFEELDAIDDDSFMTDPSRMNYHIKEWLRENGKSRETFGLLVGIPNMATLRAKLNGKARFTPEELERIEEITSIDLETLNKENPTVAQIRKEKAEARIGEYRNGVYDLTFINNLKVGVTKIAIYPEKTGEEIIISVPKRDAKKNLLVSYSLDWGRNVDIIVYFSNGTQTYIDELDSEEALSIFLKKQNGYEVKEKLASSYLLMARIGKASYGLVAYLSKKQAMYFIKKYGQVKMPLFQFMNGGSGGVMCDGKFCLIEDF